MRTSPIWMSRKRHAVPPSGGFTLVELIVVLAIVAVLVAISVPAIASLTSPKEVLRKQGRRVMKLMNEARAEAMERKVRIELRIDPALNEIRAVESHAYRAFIAADPFDRENRDPEEWALAMTNRFEKRLAFGEEFVIEGFAVEETAAPEPDEEIFRREEPPSRDVENLEDSDPEPLALAFTHFGGSDGGGVSLYYKDNRLDIAADILTGRPKIVVRREVEE